MREPDGTDAGITSLGLYLHLPFCDHKCAYCDFNSYAGLEHLIPAYIDALVRDIGLWGDLARGREVATIFFGGGTPSLTPIADLERVLDAIGRTFAVAPDVEVSLEANPGTVDERYLRGLRDAGVGRLSLGVQSFNDGELQRLDRIHGGDQAVAAFVAARAAGFDNVNLDLIFGLQQQDIAAWLRNLQRAIAMAPEHLSLYGLTIEAGTKLAWQVEHGLAPSPDPDLQADMYEATLDFMAAVGYEQYEISNWSRTGRQCRHNLIYWHNEPYLGLGAGAHGRFRDRRLAAVRAPAPYIERVALASRPPAIGAVTPLASHFPHLASEEALDALTDASDTAILGLRLNEGIDQAAFARRHGATPDELAGPALAELVEWGLLRRESNRLALTERGRLLSNEVFVRLLPGALRAESAGAASR